MRNCNVPCFILCYYLHVIFNFIINNPGQYFCFVYKNNKNPTCTIGRARDCTMFSICLCIAPYFIVRKHTPFADFRWKQCYVVLCTYLMLLLFSVYVYFVSYLIPTDSNHNPLLLRMLKSYVRASKIYYNKLFEVFIKILVFLSKKKFKKYSLFNLK